MPEHTLDVTDDRFELAQADSVHPGESVEWTFRVRENGDAVDLSESVTLQFRVDDRAYEGSAVRLDDSDDDVRLIDEPPLVDPEQGEFVVRLTEGVTDDLAGEVWVRPVVDPLGSSRATWRIRWLVG